MSHSIMSKNSDGPIQFFVCLDHNYFRNGFQSSKKHVSTYIVPTYFDIQISIQNFLKFLVEPQPSLGLS